MVNIVLTAGFDLVLWYGFTFISVYYSRLYMNELFDPHSFTFAALGYGALLKFLNLDFDLIKSELTVYVCLSILNIASILLNIISIGETTLGFFYMTKVFKFYYCFLKIKTHFLPNSFQNLSFYFYFHTF